MPFSGQSQRPPTHPAEEKYVVRQEVGKYLASFMSLTDALTFEFVPDSVKHSVKTVMSCHKFTTP